MADQQPARTPLTGSCHCGATKYILFLTLPHPLPHPHAGGEASPPKSSQRFYRCNCTVCHKAGFFHVRPASPADDFLLLSPTDPFDALGDYLCADKRLHFFYCKGCAMRCFIFMGDAEAVDADLGALGVPGHEKGRQTKAWRVKREGGHPVFGNYLSVNGHSVDAGQAFDMRALTDSKVVQYLDCLEEENPGPRRFDYPHVGGIGASLVSSAAPRDPASNSNSNSNSNRQRPSPDRRPRHQLVTMPMPNMTPSEKQWVTVKTTLPSVPYPPTASRAPLTTRRLLIRPLAESDLEALHVLNTQPPVVRWSSRAVPNSNMDVTRRQLRDKLADDATTYEVAICLGASGEMIGIGGSHRRAGNLGWPVLSYALRAEHWGRGYATEFLQAFLRWWWTLPRDEVVLSVEASTVAAAAAGEGPLKPECVTSVATEQNIASQRVMSKSGMCLAKAWREKDLSKPDEEALVTLLGFTATMTHPSPRQDK
ncbi:cellobiose dehydrogenase [Purpureocillium lavendulum]|uniref:Cellobiose dehydrogenase n=1 Tax=Purpureocillium lavendulum TaxID=1247861 RepID=A0AB34FZM5_9HYPO|nr:cellobiose dehydrogenase [Purpureocillium lavendulum]